MSRYLVTGGAGFIGSHLVDALLAGSHLVCVLDDLSTGKLSNLDSRAEMIVGSVLDDPLLGRAIENCDGVFHLAAISSVVKCNQDWAGSHAVNLTGTINVFQAAAKAHRPVVYASSAAVFGNADELPLTEATPPAPISAYGADKYGGELHAKAGWATHGLSSTGLRFFNVYGPRQDPSSPYSGVISIFADRLRADKGVTVYGDGQQTRDFIYISDIVASLIQAMATSRAEARVFNVCTGNPTSLLELLATLGVVLGIDPHITFADVRVGDIKHSVGSPERIRAELGFETSIDLKTGLARMLA